MEKYAGGYQFIAFGWRKNCRWLPVHSIVQEQGEETYGAFWCTFTGCDTESAFTGKGKGTVRKSFLEATPYFRKYQLGTIDILKRKLAR